MEKTVTVRSTRITIANGNAGHIPVPLSKAVNGTLKSEMYLASLVTLHLGYQPELNRTIKKGD